MTKHVQCPHCGQAYALTEEQVVNYAGKDITCAQCGESFLVSQDLAVTGGLATEPTAFQTRPEATAAAFPPAAASPAADAPTGMGYGMFAGPAAAAQAASIPYPSNPAPARPYTYTPPAP